MFVPKLRFPGLGRRWGDVGIEIPPAQAEKASCVHFFMLDLNPRLVTSWAPSRRRPISVAGRLGCLSPRCLPTVSPGYSTRSDPDAKASAIAFRPVVGCLRWSLQREPDTLYLDTPRRARYETELARLGTGGVWTRHAGQIQTFRDGRLGPERIRDGGTRDAGQIQTFLGRGIWVRDALGTSGRALGSGTRRGGRVGGARSGTHHRRRGRDGAGMHRDTERNGPKARQGSGTRGTGTRMGQGTGSLRAQGHR